MLVPCNPAEDSPKFSKITIPTENLNLTNGHSVKSYNLLILVSSPGPNGVVKDTDLSKLPNTHFVYVGGGWHP